MKDNLDGFILNLFRTEKKILSKQDFDSENVWVCDLLDQDLELSKQFIQHKLLNCSNRMEKLEFLYLSRSCFRANIEHIEEEIATLKEDERTGQSSNYYHTRGLSKKAIQEKLLRYKKATSMSEQAICYYIDCSKLNCEDKEETNKSKFKLSNKKGSKIDLIRVLNALYEARFVTNEDGTIPNKKDFMVECGKLFGTDLSKYHTNLSQALKNQPLEANLKIFEDLKKVIQDQHYTNKK